MKKVFFALMAAATFGLSSCGDPTFDKANPEASVKEMAESLSDSEKEEFAKAIIVVGLKSAMQGQDPEEALHGKTADEIIEMAK